MARNISMYDPLTARVVEVYEGSRYASELLNDGWIKAPEVTLESLDKHWNSELHYHGPNARGVARMCHEAKGPRGGSTSHLVRARQNGAIQTWKTRPDEFKMPFKYGMREYGYITQSNAHHWHQASDCPNLVLAYAPTDAVGSAK